MSVTIYLDDLQLEGYDLKVIEDEGKQKISFKFQVTSESYHDVAVKLYEKNFHLHIPEKNMKRKTTISNYSTSVTNLYNEGAVGEYYLELVEKNG